MEHWGNIYQNNVRDRQGVATLLTLPSGIYENEMFKQSRK